MLGMPNYSKQILATQRRKKTELIQIADITTLGTDYIEAYVIVHATITSVEETDKWYFHICTGCKRPLEMEQTLFFCHNCNRRISHPEKKFKISILASDETAGVTVVLEDREVRTLIGKRAETVFKENNKSNNFPKILQDMANQDVTIQLLIKDLNVVNKVPIYWANKICTGFYTPQQESSQTTLTMQQSTSQPSSSTYHLDGMSGLMFQSPQP